MATAPFRNGRTWYWWALGICGVLFGLGVSAIFGMSYSTMEAQTDHNVSKEAHPGVVEQLNGKLNMIERDIATLAGDVADNSEVLSEVHDAQIRQEMLLEQIKRSVNGESQ